MMFSEKLKEICKQEGINLRKFSELSTVSYGVIKNYSQGKSEPKLAQIERMTEHPRLAKYKNYLLGTDENNETISEDPEIMKLIRQCEEMGIADEAADVIRALLKHAKPK